MVQLAIVWGLIILFIFQPTIAHEGAEAGAMLFLHALLPYLLPYIILTQWLLHTTSTQDTKNSFLFRFCKTYILGSFGGFPIGAVTVSEMFKKRELTSRQAALLLAVCHAPGPMFIIGFVGIEIFQDIQLGWKLLIALHVANLLFFLLMLPFITQEEELAIISKPKPIVKLPLIIGLKESSSIILLVATTVIFFSALSNVLTTTFITILPFDEVMMELLTFSLLEMTAGVQTAALTLSTFEYYYLIIAIIIAFNGLSIHMQVAVIAQSARISLKLFIIGRFWSVLVVPFIFFLLVSIS